CALDDRAEVDPKQLVKWAKQLDPAIDDAWVHHILALAYYRAGRFDEALAHANKSNTEEAWLARNSNWPILPMAHHRLGHATEARKWLEQANRELHERSPLARSIDVAIVFPLHESNPPIGLKYWQEQGSWHDWLIFQHLLTEANTLILGHRGEAD